MCQTQGCEDWRELIREKLAAGESDQEIIEYFAEIYGEQVRATPTTRGFSKWVWIAPLIGTIIGVVCLILLLRRWLAREMEDEVSPEPPPSAQVESQSEMDDYVVRLEREIRESS